MKNELEEIARELWLRFERSWNKDKLKKRNQDDDAYIARIQLSPGRILEYVDLLLDYAEETDHEPAELKYFESDEILPLINIKDHVEKAFVYSPLKPEPGKRTIEYIVPSCLYEQTMKRLRNCGPVGQRMAAAQRHGDPTIVKHVSAEITLDSFEGLEDFFYKFMT